MDRNATTVITRCTELKNFCPQCGEQFTKNTSRQRFCSVHCQTKYWREHNVERQRHSTKEWRRNHRGDSRKVGRIRLPKGERKRPYTGVCEICGKIDNGSRMLEYHHWDDEMPAMGMYLCNRCHMIAGGVEGGLDTTYRDVRYRIEKEYAMEQLAKIGVPLEVVNG